MGTIRHFHLFAALFVLFHFTCLAEYPSTKNNSIFFHGMRIQVLTPTMIRIQKEINHSYPDITDLGVVNLKFPTVHFTVTKENNKFLIETDSITISYSPALDITQGGLTASIHGAFALKNLSDNDSLNLGGVIGSLDNCKGNIHYSEQNDVGSSPIPHPIPNGILSRRGFTVLKHTPDTLYFYKAGDSWNELYVLGYGNNYQQAFSDFYSLAGSIPMLPKWALGFIYSRWKDYDEKDYRQIVARFRKEQIPIDAIILDMCWHIDYWYGFRYDTSHFPDMKAFHRWTDSVHLKTGFNHHAGALYYKDPQIREFCARAGINYDSALTSGLPWEPEQKVIHYDPTNRKHFRTFYEMYLAHLMEDGLDFHWVDGESSIYSSDLYRTLTTEFTGKRTVVMNRLQDNVLCNHRYPFGFSGDTYISWETMAYSLETNIKGANGGVYWSHDIGGYMPQGSAGYPPDAEIFARWLQLGSVSPIFRVHAKKDIFWTPLCLPGEFDQGSRLPWEWGDTVLNSARISIQLRYKLLPYIYTMTKIASDRGIPLYRGLYIDYPQSPEAYRYDEFVFGSNILAAPILTPSPQNLHGLTEKIVWLPEGTWYDYFTQERFLGNREITVKKSLFEFPLFIKAGSIIPIAPYTEYSGATLDTLILLAYTPLEHSQNTFSLYEDDGESYSYQQGEYRWIKFDYEYEPGRFQKITIHKPEGLFKGETTERAFRISVINTSKPKNVMIDGKRIDEGNTSNEYWTWDAGKRVVTVFLSKRKINEILKIEGEM
jgi:alpha-glucosidase (family GH31 glycosyl hydrolase)